MASDDVATLDPASLDAFRSELIEAGFEPASGGPRCWRGPIAEPLRSLTAAVTMRICFQDSWPYRPPKLFVDGLVSEHAVTDGELCLYQPGESSIESWRTLASFQVRIAEWVEHQRAGFRPADAMLDAHLYFREKGVALATLDLSSLAINEEGDEAGRTGNLYGRWDRNRRVLELSPVRPSEGAHFEGRWYYHGKLVEAPPRDLATFREALTAGQRTNFDRRLKNIRKGEGPGVFALLWETRYGGRNALVIVVSAGAEEEVRVEALELAPTDIAVLQLRAGPDVETLRGKRAVVFGVGSIGSNIACRLAEAGLGGIVLVDGDRLRPGNLVRHAATFGIGADKTLATHIRVNATAPWTKVETVSESPWSPDRLGELMAGLDLAVEATGMATFSELLGRVAGQVEVPLVSAALYRGGSVGRVRRQLLGVDTPIAERSDEERYPLIPPGEEPVALEPGCSAPVNNASPVAVAAIAAASSDVAIDLLAGRLRYGDELIDVYRALDAEPFNRAGRVRG